MKTGKPKYIKNLVALRKAAKLTQKQLAQLMGLSARRIEQLETGKHRLLIDTARDYAAACEFQMEINYTPIGMRLCDFCTHYNQCTNDKTCNGCADYEKIP